MVLDRVVQHMEIAALVFLNGVEVELELVKRFLKLLRVAIVYHKGDRDDVKDVAVAQVTNFLQVEVKLVLLREGPVKLKVVHKVFLAVLSEEVESNSAATRTPLEVKQSSLGTVDLYPIVASLHHALNYRAIVAPEQAVAIGGHALVVFQIAAPRRVFLRNFFSEALQLLQILLFLSLSDHEVASDFALEVAVVASASSSSETELIILMGCGAVKPLERTQFLVRIQLVVVL